MSIKMNDYMKKVLKVSLYGLKSNKIFIALMFLLSLCLAVIWDDMFGGDEYTQVITAAMGVLLPIIMFGYVQKRSECDFYSSMPIKRSQYFFGYLISSVVSFLIVYLPASLIFAPYTNSYGSNFFFYGLAVFFAVFAVTVLAVMFSGSLFSTLVTLLILNVAVIEIVYLMIDVLRVDYNVYFDSCRTFVMMFTPFGIMYRDYMNTLAIFLILFMAVVNLVIAFFLHRRRRNENTVALAFPKTRYIIQYLAMFMAALFISSVDSFLYSAHNTLGTFIDKTFAHYYFFPYSFIAIFVTFVLTNIIFENDPRGAFKKIRHFFIFSLGYTLFFIFFIGGVLYTNLPYTFVPFDSDLVLVSVYKYEEKGRVPAGEAGEKYYYNDEYFKEPEATTIVAVNNEASEPATATAMTTTPPTVRANEIAQTNPPVAAEPTESYFQNIMYDKNEQGKWFTYSGDDYTYYYRQTDTTVYAITDKDYINYLCERVKKTDRIYRYILGHKGIIADNIYSDDQEHWDQSFEIIKNGAYICKVQFFDVDGATLDRYISVMDNDVSNIGGFQPEDKYDIPTYIDSEEAFEEFKSHTAYSVVNPNPNTSVVQLYFSY